MPELFKTYGNVIEIYFNHHSPGLKHIDMQAFNITTVKFLTKHN